MKRYGIAEIFYSLQGEGHRAGSANVFVRFAGCNLACNVAEHGFDCDTDFSLRSRMTSDELLATMLGLWPKHAHDQRWCILTGGEPLLQVDDELLRRLRQAEWSVAVETNGTQRLGEARARLINYVSVSPKGEQRLEAASEVRYVLAPGQPLPRDLYSSPCYVSPRYHANGELDREALQYCIGLVKENPHLRLSTQQHKFWGVE